MGQFKELTETMETWFSNHGSIEEVTKGDVQEVDLSTRTNFPLVHIIYLDMVPDNGFTTYNYQVLFLDTYSEAGEDKLEVLDRMGEVVTQFTQAVYSGGLFSRQIRVAVEPSADVMYDALQNRLYGWSLNVGLKVPNNLDTCA